MQRQGRTRTLALALGVALPALALGGGWLYASLQSRRAEARASRARAMQELERVRAAVEEGMEGLRRREDARPFYFYNHYYSPPDVIAITDPVAVSPLAGDPEDPRVLGYFQVEPDGTVRTPYTPDGTPGPDDRSRRVYELASSEALAALRSRRRPGANPDAVTHALQPAPVPADEPRGARVRMAEPRVAEPGANARQANMAPLTQNMNTWGQELAQEIGAAQAGDHTATVRLQQRGRQIPRTARRQLPASTPAVRPGPSRQVPRARSPARDPSRPADVEQGAQPTAGVPSGSALAQRRATEVDYTPMAYEWLGPHLLLVRQVSHAGATAVQGVVLDTDYLQREWLKTRVARYQRGEGLLLTVGRATSECVVETQLHELLPELRLCGTLVGDAGPGERLSSIQLAFLVALLLVVLGAVLVIHRAGRRAEELSAQKSAFVSAVSHELRTPLTTLRLHAEMLRDGLVSAERRPKVHDQLVSEAVRLSRLVENVLEISRLEAGKRQVHRARADLRAEVLQVLEQQRPFVEARGFVLVGPAAGPPCWVRINVQALEQIVVNLVDNSVKYAAAGERRIGVSVESDGQRAVLTVADRGPGIPAAQRQRVLERFYRVDRPEHAHAPGTGLGLALVHELAVAHGGTITVGGRDGGGAEVRVALPLDTKQHRLDSDPPRDPASLSAVPAHLRK